MQNAESAPKASAVVIDDEPSMVELLLELVAREGLTAHGATTGQQGLELISAHSPDIALVDLKMPDMTGLEVLRRARSMDPALEVIIVTAYPDMELALTAMKAGACDFLVKPLSSIDTLSEAVQRALRRRRLSVENLDLLRRIQEHERELMERIDQVTAQLHRDNAMLRQVSDLSRQLNQTLDLDHLAHVTETFFSTVDKPWAVHLLVLEEEHRRYQLLASSHVPTRMTMPRSVEVGTVPELDRLCARGEPHLIGPMSLDSVELRRFRQALIEPPSLVLPLVAGAGPLGYLAVNTPAEKPFDDLDIQLLALCAETLSLALSNCLLLQQTREQARRDGLTGLYNHSYFRDRLAQEFRRSVRYNHPLSLIMLDIDNFKQINDRCGHPAGDEVLRRLAQILRANVRQQVDIVCRYGGEEFAILLPSTDRSGAALQAERIRAAVEHNFLGNPAVGTDETLTISAGVAEHEGVRSPDELVDCADAALLRAKREGKNRVACHEAGRTGPTVGRQV